MQASKIAQFNPAAHHSDESDSSERDVGSQEQLVQASETAHFDPAADHSDESVSRVFAAAIATSRGQESGGNSDTSTDTSSEEVSSTDGDSTSSSSTSDSSSTEELATGITNYDPRSAEIAIASATMVGVVVGLSRNEDDGYDSDSIVSFESDHSQISGTAATANIVPYGPSITPMTVNSREASSSGNIPESTPNSRQEPMVEHSLATIVAGSPLLVSLINEEASLDEDQMSDDETSVAHISVSQNLAQALVYNCIDGEGMPRTNTEPVGGGVASVETAETEVLVPSDQDALSSHERGPDVRPLDSTTAANSCAAAASSSAVVSAVKHDVGDHDSELSGRLHRGEEDVSHGMDREESVGETDAQVVGLPVLATKAAAPFAETVTSFSDDSFSSGGSSRSSEGDSSTGLSWIISSTGIVGDLPSPASDSDDTESHESDSELATGIVGAFPSPDSDSDDVDSHESESEQAPESIGDLPSQDRISDDTDAMVSGSVRESSGIVQDSMSLNGADSHESESKLAIESAGNVPSQDSDGDDNDSHVAEKDLATGIVGDVSSRDSDDDDADSAGDSPSTGSDDDDYDTDSFASEGEVVSDGDLRLPNKGSDDSDSHSSEDELVPAPCPHHDSVSDFNSRQQAAFSARSSETSEALGASLIQLNGFRDLAHPPFPVDDSISDFTTRQDSLASSQVWNAPLPAQDSVSDIQTRQPTSALTNAAGESSLSATTFEDHVEVSNTSFVAVSGPDHLKDVDHQSSLLRFQQSRTSQRLSAVSNSMRTFSVARRKTIADPAMTRTYAKSDLRASMPPPELTGVLGVDRVCMRALHEHHAHDDNSGDDDDKSESSYFDSEDGSTSHVDVAGQKVTTIQDDFNAAVAASAKGRSSVEADHVIADFIAAAQRNNQSQGTSATPHVVNTNGPIQANKSILAGGQEEELDQDDIWGYIADAAAAPLEQDRSEEALLWALSRSLKRLATADRMGELALPPGMEQVLSSSSSSSSSSDNVIAAAAGEGASRGDLSSLGTPSSSSSSSPSSSVSSSPSSSVSSSPVRASRTID